MQESKDIQQADVRLKDEQSCGLMQESKDIQRGALSEATYGVVV